MSQESSEMNHSNILESTVANLVKPEFWKEGTPLPWRYMPYICCQEYKTPLKLKYSDETFILKAANAYPKMISLLLDAYWVIRDEELARKIKEELTRIGEWPGDPPV